MTVSLKTITRTATLPLTLAAAMALGAAAPAFAQAAPVPFEQADANSDGLVSLDEAKVAMPDVEESVLIGADTNGDGGIDGEEYAALTAK